MIQTCTKCKNYDISISDEPCRECQKAFRRGEGKPNFIASITNADRIRAMTDEELAEYLAPCACPPIRFNKNTGDIICPVNKEPCESDCLQCWLDWLKEEAKE